MDGTVYTSYREILMQTLSRKLSIPLSLWSLLLDLTRQDLLLSTEQLEAVLSMP